MFEGGDPLEIASRTNDRQGLAGGGVGGGGEMRLVRQGDGGGVPLDAGLWGRNSTPEIMARRLSSFGSGQAAVYPGLNVFSTS
jgi:hypothetical protein